MPAREWSIMTSCWRFRILDAIERADEANGLVSATDPRAVTMSATSRLSCSWTASFVDAELA